MASMPIKVEIESATMRSLKFSLICFHDGVGFCSGFYLAVEQMMNKRKTPKHRPLTHGRHKVDEVQVLRGLRT